MGKKKDSSAQLSLGDALAARPGKKDPAPAPPIAAEPEPVAAPEDHAPAKVARRATAEQMGQRQREISISEFFTKNRHLLGFDNPSKALLTTVKEAVDNSLDACEEAGILPEILVEIGEATPGTPATATEAKYRVAIEDNGPGIVRKQIDKVFGKLLYGSKFHRLKQSRGQQGIGISAAGMYGQLTTGKPVTVLSRVRKGQPVHSLDIAIDTRKNAPVVSNEKDLEEWPGNIEKEHGTRVEIEMVANYLHGQRFVLRYLEQTALANPHARVEYRRPRLPPLVFPRAADDLPREATEIQPHPHGIELGALQLMLAESKERSLRGFLTTSFSRVGPQPAALILEAAKLSPNIRPSGVDHAAAERLHKALAEAKLMAPPTGCLSPIGDALVRKGLINFLSVIEEEGPELELALDAPNPSKAVLEAAATTLSGGSAVATGPAPGGGASPASLGGGGGRGPPLRRRRRGH